MSELAMTDYAQYALVLALVESVRAFVVLDLLAKLSLRHFTLKVT
jgi:hypothetical protein